MITLIIPHHKETKEFMAPLFKSIETQQGLNFLRDLEILLCNDDPDYVITDFNDYPKIKSCIRNIEVPVGTNNPGISRQLGIEAARGDYVFFSDADDMFGNNLVMFDFKQIAKQGQLDICRVPFYVEHIHPDTKENLYTVTSDDFTWVFGKLFRRQYLIDNNIGFPTNINRNEDCYFIGLAFSLTKKVGSLPAPGYVWKSNQNSITRNNGGFFRFEDALTHTESTYMLIKNLKDRGIETPIDSIYQHAGYTYWKLMQKEFKEGPVALNIKIEKRLVKLFKDLNVLHKVQCEQSYKVALETFKEKGGAPDPEPYDCFIDRILKMYKDDCEGSYTV